MRGRDDRNITSNAVQEILAQRGHIAELVIHNDDSAARFVQLFNARSANVTLGTTTPDMVIQVGADSTISINMGEQEFATAFSYAVTTTATGSTGPTSVWVSISLF